MGVRFELLGAVTVHIGGDEVDVGHARQRCVLACLALEANRPVPAEQLLERVWADHAPRHGREALAGYVSRLRQVLSNAGEVTIRWQAEGYVLAVDPNAVDVQRFHDLTEQARLCADGERACGLYRQALALWRGEAFAGMDTPWLNGIRTSLEASRLAVELDYYELALSQGAHSQLVAVLSERAQVHPMDERLAGQLLLALYRCGRQADALRHYEQVRLRLADELGADPGQELQKRYAAMLRKDPELDLPARTAPNNLPVSVSSFIGRSTELAELRSALAASRLVTLTGVGGAGKSRLGLETARSALPDNPDGTWLVELAAITQPGLVAPAVAAVLGVAEHPHRPLTELLADRLRAARTLLVLDNCEHLIGEVAAFAHQLLAACTRLRILVTSREQLGVTGEVLHAVSGLATPISGVEDPESLEGIDAIQLLVDRATGLDPSFRLTTATAAAVAQICRRLDGLPLAIELAAANLNMLGINEVADGLDDRFRLLTRGGRTALARHQTLRAAIDWSYHMLGTEHRRLLNRTAVFVGGCTLSAIQAVCADDREDPLPLLARLVDVSLVVARTEVRPTRYWMLETLRTYGLERLDECGETVLLRDRHAAYIVALAESASATPRGDEQLQWSRRLEAEHGNIRAALAWSHERGDAATAIRIAGLLQALWDRHGHYTEGRDWLDRVLAMTGRASESATGHAMSQAELAGIARALYHFGMAAAFAGDIDRAAAIMQTSLQHGRAVGDQRLQAWSLQFLSWTALLCGENRRAMELLTECEACLRTDPDLECLGWVLLIRSAVTWQEGDHRDAMKILADGIHMFEDLQCMWGLSVALSLAAHRCGIYGEDTRMVHLLAASEQVREVAGAAMLPMIRPWVDEAVTNARTALGAEKFDNAWRAGQALTLDAALALALQDFL